MRGLCLKYLKNARRKGGGLYIRTWRIAYKKVVRNFDSLEIAHL